jgi:hypothetical protein
MVQVAPDADASAISSYGPITRPSWGRPSVNTTLRTRGYIDDNCLEELPVFCGFGGEPDVGRYEVTAQVIAMWYLAAKRFDVPLFNTDGWNKVDWEVGPNNDTFRSGQGSGVPGETDDPCDPDRLFTGVRWRIDIAADQQSIIEVKDWKQGAAQGEVATQLQCYQDRALLLGVNFPANSELQGLGHPHPNLPPGRWVVPYVVQTVSMAAPAVYCAFAGNRDGHLYFAPVDDPTLSAFDPNIVPRCTLGAGTSMGAGQVLEALTLILAAMGVYVTVKDKVRPTVSPPYQKRGRLAVPYTLSVPKLSRSRVINFDFGDGSSSTVLPIPAGDGIYTTTVQHTFPALSTLKRYFQTITLSEDSNPAAALSSPSPPPIVVEAITDVDVAC